MEQLYTRFLDSPPLHRSLPIHPWLLDVVDRNFFLHQFRGNARRLDPGLAFTYLLRLMQPSHSQDFELPLLLSQLNSHFR